MSSIIDKAFSKWKVLTAVLIGLSITVFMFYRALAEVHFVKVKEGKGAYSWVDGNKNNVLDFHDERDFALAESGNYRRAGILDVFHEISWTGKAILWVFGAILFTAGRDLFYIIRIRLLTKKRLTWKAGFYVIMLWEFASALSPGVVGGAAVAIFILNREGVPFGKATAIVIITAFMDNLFFVLLIPFVFLFVNQSELLSVTGGSSIFLAGWFWAGFGIIFSVCLLLYLTIFWYPKLATRFLLFIFRLPFLKRWKFIAAEWGKDIEQASKEFKQEPDSFWFKVFLSTFASWTSRYLVINAILNAFLQLGFLDNILILGKQLILWLFMLVSPTPGGSGVAEFAFGELLSDLSSSALLLAALALIWRLISYFPYLLIGTLILPSWLKRTGTK